MRPARRRSGRALWLAAALVLIGATVAPAQAQPALSQKQIQTPGDKAAAARVAVPSFWDPKRRPEKPDLTRIPVIRYMTEVNYPPFDFAGPDGSPIGFNVDLARLICEELKVNCTVQMRRFDSLVAALDANRGDAVIASIAPTADLRAKVDFTDAYYRAPARFIARRDSPISDTIPELLEGKKVAVVAGSAHEAYLKTFFTGVEIKPYPDAQAARAALRKGETDLLFGDGIDLAFWLNGTDSANCCAFRGGPFLDSHYFGDGIGIIVKKGNSTLRLALNWALFQLWEKGQFTDLWLRYFPINPF